MPTTLLGLNTDELRALTQGQGESAYRGSQLAEWIYRYGVHTFEQMTNLPKKLRADLEERYQIGRSQVALMRRSRDETVKLLLAMRDGQRVETVGLPYAGHFSCCISTQVGCPVRCAFCATGMSGYTRNLSAAEIVDQVLTVQEIVRDHQLQSALSPSPSMGEGLSSSPSTALRTGSAKDRDGGEIPLIPPASSGQALRPAQDRLSILPHKGSGGSIANPTRRISHVVFMGMGEPLLNYAATLKAVRLLNSEVGIGMRHLTVSTVGFVPGIRRLAQERLQITLAVSLHAPNDELRRQLIPTMARWSIDEILDACRQYFQTTGRRVTFEYCLLDQVNDGVAEARELVQALHGLNCHINLIPYNAVTGLGFKAPPLLRVRAFRQVLEEAGIPVTQRVQRGADIDAACGQLRRATVEL